MEDQPYRHQRNREEVVEKSQRLPNDSRKEADWTINAIAAELKISEAAKLQSLELGI